MQSRKIKKGEQLLDINQACNYLYFIDKGILRGHYFLETKEITNWFAQENEFATCFYSFIAKKPSVEGIQALENSEITQISYSALQTLYSTFPETERAGRIITETYYLKLEERLLSIQFKSAKERYQNLLETKPSIVKRAAMGQIATYLGISQETLSRMRADLG
ncbi:cyclic nucleotide-binding protein [Sphingobacteriaceae bacterium]|nr:cyclic nucleotide-binding protein [Sphingobacteriaceae bacterium]